MVWRESRFDSVYSIVVVIQYNQCSTYVILSTVQAVLTKACRRLYRAASGLLIALGIQMPAVTEMARTGL